MTVQNPDSEPSRPEAKKRPQPTSIMRFAGMGVQLAVAIGLGVFAGLKVDEHLELGQPIGTALLGLLGLAAGMYQVLKALS
jgi:F0F1-type ATP synthase assembly protein I